jgi:hypothetical protein
VTDGNHKCFRLRCLSDNTLINSSQVVQVGCDNQPERGSYFCANHNSLEQIKSYDLDDE